MTQQVVIHCKESLFDWLVNSSLQFEYNCGEYDVVVDDVPYKQSGTIYQDPDEQFCEHYGIDYDQVNCIELA